MVELTKTDINRIVDGLYKSIKEKEDKRPASTKAQIKKDLEELCRHPKLKDITYKRGVLRFYTVELPIKLNTSIRHRPFVDMWCLAHRNKKFNKSAVLGEFEITQYIRGSRTRTRITNLTNKKAEYYDHPHITNGSPCFDKYTEIKNKLVKRLELVGYIELILQFLDNYEPPHTYSAMQWLEQQ